MSMLFSQALSIIKVNKTVVLYRNIDQKLVNSLHGLLNYEIGGLDCHVITIDYKNKCSLYTHVTPFL